MCVCVCVRVCACVCVYARARVHECVYSCIKNSEHLESLSGAE